MQRNTAPDLGRPPGDSPRYVTGSRTQYDSRERPRIIGAQNVALVLSRGEADQQCRGGSPKPDFRSACREFFESSQAASKTYSRWVRKKETLRFLKPESQVREGIAHAVHLTNLDGQEGEVGAGRLDPTEETNADKKTAEGTHGTQITRKETKAYRIEILSKTRMIGKKKLICHTSRTTTSAYNCVR